MDDTMDELLARYLDGLQHFGARVQAVTESQWTAATPDTEWTVADLVEHVTDEERWLPPLLHGLDLATAGDIVAGSRRSPIDGGIGANLASDWDEVSTAAHDAVTAPGALDREVELSRGTTPARAYVSEMTFDLAVHAWDLGQAIGFTDPLPDALIAFVYRQVSDYDDLSGSGVFGKPIAVAPDASTMDKLLALTGRDPR